MSADASIDFCQHGATGMHGEEIFEKCPRAKVLRTEGLGLLEHLIHQYYIFFHEYVNV